MSSPRAGAVGRLVVMAVMAMGAAVAAATATTAARPTQILPFPEDIDEDFQFEMRNLYTDRKNGARINIFVKYRYYDRATLPSYTTETGTFSFLDVEKVIWPFVPAGGKGLAGSAFVEVLTREIAEAVWRRFPIRGLSIRLEVQGMSEGGLPDHYASTVTVGEIEPWVSLVNQFPGCDGMSTGKGNEACRVWPTWKAADPKAPRLRQEAARKAGRHDKPDVCDFCA